MSEGEIIHSQFGNPFYLHQHYLDACRQHEYQIEAGGGICTDGRGSGKSSLRTKAIPIQLLLKHPDIVIFLFSATKNLSAKHVSVIKQELERNKTLNILFPEILWPNPRKAVLDGQTTWSVDKGLCVQRKMVRTNNTIERHAFLGAGGVGSRPDVIIVDDVEHPGVVNNPENIQKIKEAMSAAVTLLTPVAIKKPILLITNTKFSPNGVVEHYFQQYMALDPKRVRAVPAEELDLPGDGPMGGKPIYPFDKDTLWQKYNESVVKGEYGLQYCLRYDTGSVNGLKEDNIQWYSEEPEKHAAGCPIYIGIDASRGVYDPTAAFVWALKNKKYVWVDALVKKLDPTSDKFYRELHDLVQKWKSIGYVAQVRVEAIAGQPWKDLIEREFNKMGCYVNIVGSTEVSAKGKGRGKEDKIFERWAPMINQGNFCAPKPMSKGGIGLHRADENGVHRCLVDYFLAHEFRMFPYSHHDDMLDAGGLIEDKKLNAEFPLIWNTSNSGSQSRMGRDINSSNTNTSWMSAI